MATASISSSLRSSEERANGFKLMRLIIDGGTEALRNVFQKKYPGDLKTVLATYLSTLQSLKIRHIITSAQWVKLYPPMAMIPNIYEFDITLLLILLRNICGISAPKTGWDVMPSDTDNSLEADIVRIKEFRNKYFGHIPGTGVSNTEFEDRWKEVSVPLVNLGISQVEIDRLKHEECGQEEVDRFIQESRENFSKVEFQLLGLKKMRTEDHELLLDIRRNNKSDEQQSDNILNKHLNRCDLGRDIELLCKKWCKDTREWVFDQVSEWFKDTTSENRAFVITGQPGMGKSVIAAVICERFAEQLAASHFCQYNNDKYNNPKILLQSLAKQLSNVLPEYKKTLIEKLSGKEGQILDDMNIQGLFSTLFKEPLTGIDVEKKYVIVIDAVDESERKGKSDLVDLIANYLDQLPSFIRVLITTRPENHILEKFEKLNPMFLSPNDEQNLKDIQCLLEEKLSQGKAKHIKSLTEKSKGLMLFANYLIEIIDDSTLNLGIDDLPIGIKGIYISYFKRWEKSFQDVEVTEHEFLSFLGIMAVAKEPLPEALVEKVFDSKNNSRASGKRKMNKIKNCLSLFLVVQQGRFTFFHKSVKDWLVEYNHEFQVDERFGNETLANICAKEMDEFKKKKIKPPFDPAAEYALLYGIQHKLAGTQGELMNSFIERYVTDLEIMYASISVDVYATFNNIKSLKKDLIYNSVPEEARRTVETLMLLIRRYSYTFFDFSQSFLQHVLNWGGEGLSSKAASLLNDRYKDLIYFQLIEKDGLENSLVYRICRPERIRDLAISPKEEYLVCLYTNIKIELFSIEDFKSLWTIENYMISEPYPMFVMSELFISKIAFHPLKNVILCGRLDHAINMQGKFEPGPFSCNDINAGYHSCCFSNDQRKMATIFSNDLSVWNLVSGERLKSFSGECELLSVSFSANGRFLATSNEGAGVVVYDLERGYMSTSKSFDEPIYFVSTFKSDSWYCIVLGVFTTNTRLYTVSHDLSTLYPVNHGLRSRPLNVTAAAKFEDFLGNPHFLGENLWSRILSIYVGFFCLNHDIALFWHMLSSELDFHRISKLDELQSVRNYHDISANTHIDISVDGELLYIAGRDDLRLYKVDSNYSFHVLSNTKWSDIAFVPVTNGVFLCRKPDDSRDCFGSRRFQIGIPELWNSDLTQHLGSFPELSDTENCLSVSEDIVACIMTGQVCFFNVVERKIVSKTSVPQGKKVLACSSRYYVLLSHTKSPYLCRDGEVVAKLAEPLDYGSLQDCVFSPSSEKLALNFDNDKAVYIFDVALAKLRHKVHFQFFPTLNHLRNILQFLDEDHLLRPAYLSSLCIINVSNGNALSCVNIDGPASLCVSRKQDNGSVLLCLKTWEEKIRLIKVWLPR